MAPSFRARLDRDRDGFFVFLVGVILFRVAAAVYFLTDLLVAAAPVTRTVNGTGHTGPLTVRVTSGPSGKFCYNILYGI